jgi:S1-C subfamily serine protease
MISRPTAMLMTACCAGSLWCAMAFWPPAARLGADEPAAHAKKLVVSNWQQVARLAPRSTSKTWQPAVNLERERGAAADVYETVAPATVVVRSDTAHGTGLLVGERGWVLTNHHVIEDAALDVETATRTVQVYLGQLGDDRFIHLIETPMRAVVYKSNEEKDLALLKLDGLPQGMTRTPTIKLARTAPAPGDACVAIGHPAAGMLWTVREGVISGVGNWPADMIDVVMQRLSLEREERQHLDELCSQAGQRKVLISTCGLNPGDSGGPLVNSQGELVAVSFAIPGADAASGINLAKFSYHVHLDEVRAFLADWPDKPEQHVPSLWPPALYAEVRDLDDDRTPETVVFTTEVSQDAPTGIVFDLDQDSPLDQNEEPSSTLDFSKWDVELAIQHVPLHRTFYDTDNDGQMDLILTDRDGDGLADHEMRRTSDTWKLANIDDAPLISPRHFASRTLQKRLKACAAALNLPLRETARDSDAADGSDR